MSHSLIKFVPGQIAVFQEMISQCEHPKNHFRELLGVLITSCAIFACSDVLNRFNERIQLLVAVGVRFKLVNLGFETVDLGFELLK